MADDQGTVHVVKNNVDGRIMIVRHATRGDIPNFVNRFTVIDANGEGHLLPLEIHSANTILDRIAAGKPWASCFVFSSVPDDDVKVDMAKTEMEHRFTSTGVKFWRHPQQLVNYFQGRPGTVISTHVSPEGICNLRCPYCSVTYRDTHARIPLPVIKDYIEKLTTRGLKAVILTGGGEPTVYPLFNDLVQWLKYKKKLSVALITNGTLPNRIEYQTWKAFSWVRVSINMFDGWEEKINIPTDQLDDDCTLGFSMVYTPDHEITKDLPDNWQDIFKKVSRLADRMEAQYIRLLPNCLLDQNALVQQHAAMAKVLEKVNDDRFFHQHKYHEAPKSGLCHQAYFRPYLSEEIFPGRGPGTVYPCDSVVLNDSYQHFAKEYQICYATDVLGFLDGTIKMKFDPRERCKGCVFSENVNMLHDWKGTGKGEFHEHKELLRHEEFV